MHLRPRSANPHVRHILVHFPAISDLQIGVHEDEFSVLSTRISKIFVA